MTDRSQPVDLDDPINRRPAYQVRYDQLMSQHPDCRDPGHPGCGNCMPDVFDDYEPAEGDDD